MDKENGLLIDVGMVDLQYPIKVISKANPNGQMTIANISINARIMREFEARWIDKFERIFHLHRDSIGTMTLKENIKDYLLSLKASIVRIDLDYPFFIEKTTPLSNASSFVRYQCRYSVEANSEDVSTRTIFKISVPVITTYPVSGIEGKDNLFAQKSIVDIEIESNTEIYPEELVDVVESHGICPVYSYLTEHDQNFIIDKAHSEKKTSDMMIDEIKNILAQNDDIKWYKIRCFNYGMLHSYSTVIGIEKNMWNSKCE